MVAVLAIGGVLSLFVLAAMILAIRDRLTARPPLSPDERHAAVAAWDARVLAPDWTAVERRLGQPAPAILRELYGNRDLLLSPPITIVAPVSAGGESWDVATFQPLDAEGTESGHFGIPPRAVCFATTRFGDPYYVEFGAHDDDGSVFVLYHDGGDVVRVARSLREFLAWPRHSNGDHRDAGP